MSQAENDYEHFGQLHTAFLTLSSTATEGSWPAELYSNMYGCRDYYRQGHRCCMDTLGNGTEPFGALQIMLHSRSRRLVQAGDWLPPQTNWPTSFKRSARSISRSRL